MSDATLAWLMIGLIVVLTFILLALFKKRTVFEVFDDLIVIDDLTYPARIPNYAIKSIGLVEVMPKVLIRSNGYGGLRQWKGVFRLVGGKRAFFYVENRSKGPIIKIETVRENIYINFKNREETHELYDELTNKVKLLNENELVDCQMVSTFRSWAIVGVFIAIITLVALIPIF